MTTKNETEFQAWMRAVDIRLNQIAGVTHRDLADYGYRDAFEDGVPVEGVVADVLDDNGWEAVGFF